MFTTAEERVAKWFDRRSAGWDALYSGDRPLWLRLWDAQFRKNIPERFRRTREALAPVADKRILDVGCGSGQYSIAFAADGAEVVGVDLSAKMIALAESLARSRGVEARCRFLTGDFLSAALEGSFDAAVAIGLFDYTPDPGRFLSRLRGLVRGPIIATYPSLFAPRVPFRKLWLASKGCPVFFYTPHGIRDLYRSQGLEIESLESFFGLYFVRAR